MKIKRFIYKFICLIFNRNTLKKFEIFFSLLQGKGYGIGNIDHEVKSCRELIENKEVKIILDIGSHHGEFSNHLYKNYKNADYYLFEPSLKNFNILIKKFSGIDNFNISKLALSDQNRKSKLYFNKNGSDQASLLKRYLNKNMINFKMSEDIEERRLDHFFRGKLKNAVIDICKIDVEGLEMKVIKGFGRLIKKVKLVQFEFSGANISSKVFFRDFWNFFEQNGFLIYIITPLGPKIIKEYDMSYETFRVTNYIALNKKI